MKDIVKRVLSLEQKFGKSSGYLSYEQFLEEWNTMDDLSHAVLIGYAECPEMQEGSSSGELQIYKYLHTMGVAKTVCSIDDVLKEVTP